jgi:hypothetical protein
MPPSARHYCPVPTDSSHDRRCGRLKRARIVPRGSAGPKEAT